VLLQSAADSYGDGVLGVVLTGANADGATGLARLVERGGTAIVQDPQSAERRECRRRHLAAVPAARVAELDAIGPLLVELVAGAGEGAKS